MSCVFFVSHSPLFHSAKTTVARQFARCRSNFLLSAGFSPQTVEETFADKPLLTYGEHSHLTYAEVNRKCGRLAHCLSAIYKVKKGDVVLSRTSKHRSVLLYLATLRLGAIYVPLNPTYTVAETEHFVENSQPKLFVTCARPTDSAFLERVQGAVVDEKMISEQSSLLSPMLDVESVGDGDVATIIYTSGTTGNLLKILCGKPKGAALSHGALRRNAEALVENWRFTSNDVLLHALPFYHIHGMFLSFHCTLLSKSSAIFLDKFDASNVIDSLPNATVFMGVPSYYSRLLASERFCAEACANIRLFVSGSAPLPKALAQEFRRRSGGHRLLQRYGMSEAMVITAEAINEPSENSVGKPLPDVQVRISNENVVEVKSPSLFNGYWREAEKTKKEFTSDGWFVTGDVGRLDENGNLYLEGRQKDLIISGGLNVYPKEVEDAIESTGHVAESAVIGVPHRDFGEAVIAVCVPKNIADVADEASAAEMMALDAARELAPYKRPKKWIFVENLPRNSMAKIKKKKLIEGVDNALKDLAAPYVSAAFSAVGKAPEIVYHASNDDYNPILRYQNRIFASRLSWESAYAAIALDALMEMFVLARDKTPTQLAREIRDDEVDFAIAPPIASFISHINEVYDSYGPLNTVHATVFVEKRHRFTANVYELCMNVNALNAPYSRVFQRRELIYFSVERKLREMAQILDNRVAFRVYTNREAYILKKIDEDDRFCVDFEAYGSGADSTVSDFVYESMHNRIQWREWLSDRLRAARQTADASNTSKNERVWFNTVFSLADTIRQRAYKSKKLDSRAFCVTAALGSAQDIAPQRDIIEYDESWD